MSESTLLEIEDLKIRFKSRREDVQVVHGIHLSLQKKASIGIVGESGSGKSQTALSIMKLIGGKPGISGGSIIFKGENIAEYNDQQMSSIRGHEIAIIFQDAKASLIPYQTIKEQVLDTHKSLGEGRTKEQMVTYARELLKEMNFSDPERVLHSYPNQLSGGECQRAYVMLTLLGKPSLLIADEPTSSLDPVTSSQIIELLRKICDKLEIALIMISHDLAEIVGATDYIYVFYNGHVVEEFPSSWVRKGTYEPLHPYSRFLFSMFSGEAFQQLRQEETSLNGIPGNRKAMTNGCSNGCVYTHRCDLHKELEEELQRKCHSVHPDLSEVRESSRVACWGAEENEG